MERAAPAEPGSRVATEAMPNICRETVSPAFRFSRISLEKWLRDTAGATVEAVLAAPLIRRRVPLAKDAVVFTL